VYNHGAFVNPGYGEMCNLLFANWHMLTQIKDLLEDAKVKTK
jgi:hypothetical protein